MLDIFLLAVLLDNWLADLFSRLVKASTLEEIQKSLQVTAVSELAMQRRLESRTTRSVLTGMIYPDTTRWEKHDFRKRSIDRTDVIGLT